MAEEEHLKSNDERAKKQKNKKKNRLLKEASEVKEEEIEEEEEEWFPMESVKVQEEEEEEEEEEENSAASRKIKRKKRLLKEAEKADRRGVCYLSRIPPRMDHVNLRHILSHYGEVQRIYLTPGNPATQIHRKRPGKLQGQSFSEGWVEFTDKKVAKRVANMLNAEQVGGRKRSSFYYDLWNIKYLSKFKWDDLTAEIAYKSAVREQKLALEISAAKRDSDFILSKVDQSRALSSIDQRLKKKQKVQQESGTNSELPVSQLAAKVIRQFPQTQPVADNAAKAKSGLSKDILAGVFGGS